MMPDRRTSHWSRLKQRVTAATPEPCWRDGCTNDAATVQDERFRGRYCAGCLELVRADAERMTEELGTC